MTDSFFNQVMDEIGPGVWDERIHTKNKSMYEERRSGINTGWNVQVMNNLPNVLMPGVIEAGGHDGGDIADYQDFREDINIEWYVQEAEKLVKPLLD